MSIHFRECTVDDYVLPGTDVHIKRGWEVHIPVEGIHMDPKIYPNPTTFDPERFSKEERAKRHPLAFQVRFLITPRPGGPFLASQDDQGRC